MEFPKTIYFCNRTLDKMEMYASNWKKLNPEYDVQLFDNQMCENFLLEEYGELYKEIFNYIPDGPIKADFWRICILYKYGGVYSDIDNEPIVPIKDFLEPDVGFLTCSSYSSEMSFNPNFIIAHKGCSILKRCIDWYLNKYTQKHHYGYWQWSIMRAFTDTLQLANYHKDQGIYDIDNIKVQIMKECPGNDHYDAHNLYKGKRVFNNRYRTWNHNTHSF